MFSLVFPFLSFELVLKKIQGTFGLSLPLLEMLGPWCQDHRLHTKNSQLWRNVLLAVLICTIITSSTVTFSRSSFVGSISVSSKMTCSSSSVGSDSFPVLSYHIIYHCIKQIGNETLCTFCSCKSSL